MWMYSVGQAGCFGVTKLAAAGALARIATNLLALAELREEGLPLPLAPSLAG